MGWIMRGRLLIVVFPCFFLMVSACDMSGFSSEPARRMIKKKCTICHSSNRIYDQARSAGEWDRVVLRMERHGAFLTDKERAIISNYLKDGYGR